MCMVSKSRIEKIIQKPKIVYTYDVGVKFCAR